MKLPLIFTLFIFVSCRAFGHEVQKNLVDTLECGGLRFLLLQYFKVIELLAKLWKQGVQSHAERIIASMLSWGLNILLEELEFVLRGNEIQVD